MNTNVRSALVGGLAATFVVAAAFAPKLMSSDHTDVNFHQTAAEASLPTETTTLVETTATEVTTTTTAPVVATTAPVPVTTTTTATTPPSVSSPQVTASDDGVALVIYVINHYPAQYPNAKVRFTVMVQGAAQEITLPIPAVEANGTPATAIHYNVTGGDFPQFTPTIVSVDWDGGTLVGGQGHATT